MKSQWPSHGSSVISWLINQLSLPQILPVYMVLAIEWKTRHNFSKAFVSGQLIEEHRKLLPLLESPDLFVESNGAKSIIDADNEYQYLVYKNQNIFAYITR